MANWVQTASGRNFYPTEPKEEDVYIEDIAHALSLMCRFGGHCKTFYSVAEHSVRASWLVPFEHGLACLLHDAAEAYFADIVKPIKMEFPIFEEIENKILNVIFKKYGLVLPFHESVTQADITMLFTEKRDLMTQSDPWQNPTNVGPLKGPIQPWDPDVAKSQYLLRFDELY